MRARQAFLKIGERLNTLPVRIQRKAAAIKAKLILTTDLIDINERKPGF